MFLTLSSIQSQKDKAEDKNSTLVHDAVTGGSPAVSSGRKSKQLSVSEDLEPGCPIYL